MVEYMPEAMKTPGKVSVYWFQIGFIAFFSYLAALLARRLHIPDIIALIFIAILLSPASGIGVFDLEVAELAWLAVMFKVLHSGLSLNLKHAISQFKPTILIGALTFLVPFFATLGFGSLVYSGVFDELGLFQKSFYTPDFFFACGLAFAVAPLALIDDILDAANIRRTPFGTMVISSQVLNEIITWSIFALVVGSFIPDSGYQLGFLPQIISISSLVAIVIGLAFFKGEKYSKWLEKRKFSSAKLSTITTIITILLCSTLDKLFHGGIICALLIGVLAGSIPYAGSQIRTVGTNFIKVICLPLFFYNSFSSVNIFEFFHLELFVLVVILGVLPSYCGAFFASLLSSGNRRNSHRVGIAASAIGVSSLIIIDFLLQNNSPGKAELLSAMAISVPITSYVAGLILRSSFINLSKNSLRKALDRHAVRFLRPFYPGAPGFLVEEIIQERFQKQKDNQELNRNELIFLSSIFKASPIKNFEPNKKFSFIKLPTSALEDKIKLEILMVKDGQMDFREEELDIVFILWVPDDNIEMGNRLSKSIPLMIEALKNNNFSLLKRISSSKEEVNPIEIIWRTLEDVDSHVSEGLVRQVNR